MALYLGALLGAYLIFIFFRFLRKKIPTFINSLFFNFGVFVFIVVISIFGTGELQDHVLIIAAIVAFTFLVSDNFKNPLENFKDNKD